MVWNRILRSSWKTSSNWNDRGQSKDGNMNVPDHSRETRRTPQETGWFVTLPENNRQTNKHSLGSEGIKSPLIRPVFSSKESQSQPTSTPIPITQSQCSSAHPPSSCQLLPSLPSSWPPQNPSHAVVAAAAMALCNAATRPTRQAISLCSFPRWPLTSSLFIRRLRKPTSIYSRGSWESSPTSLSLALSWPSTALLSPS
ncbi:hypothetical protein SCLCIDRAFT_874358 [Scleroderma citrinum Foug A]|uniref:Uncharacterized protein n=1 Tax=Scleroderma citrinum Foug A TaxID=1036808 RepID=A0A0C2ZIQ3_9AGAM|nr:hypothetical protein SCLCIDRAFT_874358 [Scleroderma citrinum Foug A]